MAGVFALPFSNPDLSNPQRRVTAPQIEQSPNLLLSTLAPTVTTYGPYEWNNPQLRTRAPEVVDYPNLVLAGIAPPPPPLVTIPVEWSNPAPKPRRAQEPEAPDLLLSLSAPPGLPFSAFNGNDWPNPLRAKLAPQIVEESNLLLTTIQALPFRTQIEWPNPLLAKRAPELVQYPNLVLQLGVAPVVTYGPYDWQNPAPKKREAQAPEAPNLALGFGPSTSLPGVQVDWNPPPRKLAPQIVEEPNLVLALGVAQPWQVRAPIDGQRQFVKVAPQIFEYPNLLLTTLVPIVLPFAPQPDWPNPQRPKILPQIVEYPNLVQQLNLGYKFEQPEWPNPQRAKLSPQVDTYENLTLTLGISPSVTFGPYDWPNPQFRRDPNEAHAMETISYYVPTVFTVPVWENPQRARLAPQIDIYPNLLLQPGGLRVYPGFGPYDWQNPQLPKRQRALDEPAPNLLLGPGALQGYPHFGPYDWPNPLLRKAAPQIVEYPNLILKGIASYPGFGPYDWPNPILRKTAPQIVEYPNTLLKFLTGNLFTPFDWPNPLRRKDAPQIFEYPNLALSGIAVYPNFGPYDWPNPAQPKKVPQFDHELNYLFLSGIVPVTFGPYEWNNPPPPKRAPQLAVEGQNLLVQGVFTGNLFTAFDWQNPLRVKQQVPLVELSPNLWLTTLYQSPVVVFNGIEIPNPTRSSIPAQTVDYPNLFLLHQLKEFGYCNLIAVSQGTAQTANSKYLAGSSCLITAAYFDLTRIPFIPNTIQYRVDDLTSLENLVPWTPITPPLTTSRIIVTSTQNQMVSLTRKVEQHQLLLQITDNFGNVFYARVIYKILNGFFTWRID